MDDQSFDELFHSEELYSEFEDTLSKFYENFDMLGQDLSNKERTRRNQMYEEQLQQLEEQMSMLEEIHEVSGESMGELGEGLEELLRDTRNDLKKYQIAYKRAYKDIGRDRDKFFEDMEVSFGELSSRITQIFTAFKVDQIVDSMVEVSDSYATNRRQIRNIRGYDDSQMEQFTGVLNPYLDSVRASGGRLNIGDYSSKVEEWIEYGFSDDMAASMGYQSELIEKTLGIDISNMEDLINSIWYRGYSTAEVLGDMAKNLKKIKTSEEFQEADIEEILRSVSDSSDWLGFMSKDQADFERLSNNMTQALAIASANGFSESDLAEMFKGLYMRDTDLMAELARSGVDVQSAYSEVSKGEFVEGFRVIIEDLMDRAESLNADTMSLDNLSEYMNMDWLFQASAISKAGGIDWDVTNKALNDIESNTETLEDNLSNVFVSGFDRIENILSNSKIGQWWGELQASLGFDNSDVALVSTAALQLAELIKIRKSVNGGDFLKNLGKNGGLFKKLFGESTEGVSFFSLEDGILQTSGKGILGKILGSTGTGTIGGSGVLGGLSSVGSALGSTATTGTGLAIAGATSIAGGALGAAGLVDAATDLWQSTQATKWQEKEVKQKSAATKAGLVAAGAAIGSVVPGVGTLIGAGVGGLLALIGGDKMAESIQDYVDGTNDVKKALKKATDNSEDYSKAVDNKKAIKGLVEQYDDLYDELDELTVGTEAYEKVASKLDGVIDDINDIYPGYTDLAGKDYKAKKEAIEVIDNLTEAELNLSKARVLASKDEYMEGLDSAVSQYSKSKGTLDSAENNLEEFNALSGVMNDILAKINTGELVWDKTSNTIKQGSMSDEDYKELINSGGDVLDSVYDTFDVGKMSRAIKTPWTDGSNYLSWALDEYNTRSSKSNVVDDFNEASADALEKKANLEVLLNTQLGTMESMLGDQTWEDLASSWNTLSSTDKSMLLTLGEMWGSLPVDLKRELSGIFPDMNKLEDLAEYDLDQSGNIGSSVATYTDPVFVGPLTPEQSATIDSTLTPEQSVTIDGSHAEGLDRVPFNGYVAELHEDEAVLPRNEAQEWREGIGSSVLEVLVDIKSALVRGLSITATESVDLDRLSVEDSDKMSVMRRDDSNNLQSVNDASEFIVSVLETAKSDIADIWTDIMSDAQMTAEKKTMKKQSLWSRILGIDGSHSDGLDYVPYDGYIAELHKGEAVIPKEENPYVAELNEDFSISSDNDPIFVEPTETTKVLPKEITQTVSEVRTVTPYQPSIEVDNSELTRVVRQGFEAVLKKMDQTNQSEAIVQQVPQRTKKPFQSAALFNLT